MIDDPAFNGRIEGRLKVAGAAMYAAETPMPGMLYAALVEAPVAHGIVLELDTSAAFACPGVVDVVGRREAVAMLRPAPAFHFLLERQVHFVGQALALVVAESAAQARDGAAAVRVRYVESPAVASVEAGVPYAPDMCGIRGKSASLRGSPGVALAHADAVVRARFTTAANNHHPLEPHAVVCAWSQDDRGERLEVHTCTQGVFVARELIAAAFGLELEQVRVVATYLGGGFGCKGHLWLPWLLTSIIAAKRTGRPVRLELTRGQLFTLVGRRSSTVQDLMIGADAQGRIVGIEHDVLAQTSTYGPEFADSVALVSRYLYGCPNVRTSHRLVRTNEPQPIPMRGPGEAPGSFALESALNQLAEQLNIDPVAMRLKNIADHDQQTGLPWSSNGLAECLMQGAEQFGWWTRSPRNWTEGRQRIGWGMSSVSYPANRQPCDVRIRLHADGTALVQCGTQDMGAGTYTALARFAAEELGLTVERVEVQLGDTRLPRGPRSSGSQVTQSFAPAMAAATASLRGQIADRLAADPGSLFGKVAAAELEFSQGSVRRRGANVSLALTDLLQKYSPNGLEAQGEAAGMPAAPLAVGMGFGAVFAEVAVNPLIGEVRVRRITAAYAAGRILNPTLARNQYVSALVGGVGMALQEETLTDPRSGRVVGTNFADYIVPVNADMPSFDIVMVPENDPYLPEGVKGIGMLGHIGVAAAIAEAVYQAVGKRVRRLPIRLEDVMADAEA